MMGQEIQGVPAPLIVQTKTMVEKVRMVKLSTIMYRTIKSFTESSLKNYPWRIGYEYPTYFEWVKEGRWVLQVFKNVTKVDANAYERLPVRGIYKITDSVIPFAVLNSNSLRGSIDFVVLNEAEIGMLYYGRVTLAFTSEAPVAFVPTTPLPYARPISIREIVDTLLNYVSF
jgi:hypothetical protein